MQKEISHEKNQGYLFEKWGKKLHTVEYKLLNINLVIFSWIRAIYGNL